MPPARHAVATAAANHVSFTRDQLTRLEVVHIRSHLDNFANKLMPDNHRYGNRSPRPVVPVEDVNVRAANSGTQDANEDIVDADCGLGNIFQPQARLTMRFD